MDQPAARHSRCGDGQIRLGFSRPGWHPEKVADASVLRLGVCHGLQRGQNERELERPVFHVPPLCPEALLVHHLVGKAECEPRVVVGEQRVDAGDNPPVDVPAVLDHPLPGLAQTPVKRRHRLPVGAFYPRPRTRRRTGDSAPRRRSGSYMSASSPAPGAWDSPRSSQSRAGAGTEQVGTYSVRTSGGEKPASVLLRKRVSVHHT